MGLFCDRQVSTVMMRSSSRRRPTSGAYLPCSTNAVRSRPNLSSAGVFDLLPIFCCGLVDNPRIHSILHLQESEEKACATAAATAVRPILSQGLAAPKGESR